MPIRAAQLQDKNTLSEIIRTANQAVAQQFHITYENNPKHPSFYTPEWVESDFQRGEQYFIYQQDGKVMGCVAYEKPNGELAYLNRLSVLPDYQRRGVGEKLVRHIIQLAQAEQVKQISIGIIGEHEVLYRWYQKLGFQDSERKQFAHLPFSVKLMLYSC